MACPPEVSEVLLRIIEAGLFRIRCLGWAGDSDRCALEADHIHNLPDLLAAFSRERLAYYWNIERPSYMAQTAGEQLTEWEELWQSLQPHVDALDASTAAG